MVNWTNVTQPSQILNLPNENTGGNFWVSIVFMLWVVLIILFSALGFEIAFLGASFLMLMLSVFLVYAGLMSWTWCLFFFGAILFMFFYIIWSGSKT